MPPGAPGDVPLSELVAGLVVGVVVAPVSGGVEVELGPPNWVPPGPSLGLMPPRELAPGLLGLLSPGDVPPRLLPVGELVLGAPPRVPSELPSGEDVPGLSPCEPPTGLPAPSELPPGLIVLGELVPGFTGEPPGDAPPRSPGEMLPGAEVPGLPVGEPRSR